MAAEGTKTYIFPRWEASWADSEDASGNLSIWPTWEHYFSKVLLWPTPNVGSGLPWRKLLPHVHAPTAAQATRINRFPLLHLLRRSPGSTCCTGRAAQYARAAALATQITMLQVLDWPHRSPMLHVLHWLRKSQSSTCRTGSTNQRARRGALPTQITMLDMY